MRRYRVLSKVIGSEAGASTVEYGMIVAFIFLVIFVAVQALADQTVGMWDDVATKTTAALPKN